MGRTLTGPGHISKSGDTMLGAFNEAIAKDIASATSVNLVISTGNLIDITGNQTIISMHLGAGAERTLRFTGNPRLTHSESLYLPGGEDIITEPGDFAIVRGYANGIVRVVSYTRSSGFVKRVGDKMQGTLTLTAGTLVVAPFKFQLGVLTNLNIPHACEWNGSNLFQTNSSGVRKQLMYTDGNGSSLTDFTSAQITSGLGYTPFNPGLTTGSISPPGGIIEVGSNLDFHHTNLVNNFDARIECSAPSGGYGSSILNIVAAEIRINSHGIWNQANLTNLNQLTNGPGYATLNNPTFTGKVVVPEGSAANPGIAFTNDGVLDTGFYHISDGIFGVTCNGIPITECSTNGTIILKGGNTTNNGGTLRLQRDIGGSNLVGNVAIGTSGQSIRLGEDNGSQRGAYLDLTTCKNNMSSRILTDDNLVGVSRILTVNDLGYSSLNTSGYQVFPSGLIMQWGNKPDGGVNSGYVSFPITFPNICASLITSYNITNQRGNYGSGGSVTTSGAYIHTDGCSTFWLALGF